MKVLKVKDFDIICFRCGSRVLNGPEYAYKIVYNAPDGREVRLNGEWYRKVDAQKHIREMIKRVTAVYEKAHENA